MHGEWKNVENLGYNFYINTCNYWLQIFYTEKNMLEVYLLENTKYTDIIMLYTAGSVCCNRLEANHRKIISSPFIRGKINKFHGVLTCAGTLMPT